MARLQSIPDRKKGRTTAKTSTAAPAILRMGLSKMIPEMPISTPRHAIAKRQISPEDLSKDVDHLFILKILHAGSFTQMPDVPQSSNSGEIPGISFQSGRASLVCKSALN